MTELKKSHDDYKIKYEPIRSDDESYELEELKVKSKNRFSPKDKPIKKDDVYILQLKDEQSLHSIAFKYNCTLWELKRLNNLFSSQDFFSLKEIKIPCPKNSYRSVLLKDDGAQKMKTSGAIDFDKKIENTEKDENQNANNSQFFENMDNNIEKVKNSVGIILNKPNFDAKTYHDNQIYNFKTQKKSPFCKWWHYLLIFVICVCIGPIIYALYVLWNNGHKNLTLSMNVDTSISGSKPLL